MEDVAEWAGDQGQVDEPAVEEAKVRSLWNRAELCSEGGTALIGGGLALLCSDKHRRLATLLLTCGLLVKGWGGIQDRKKERKDRNKDSNKDKGREPTKDSGSGTAVKLMGVTGKPQEGYKVGTGDKTQDKNRKDPSWTEGPMGSNGSATPKGLVDRETPQNPSQCGLKEVESVVDVGGRKPGIRAFRNERKEGRGEDVNSHGTFGDATAASGAATIRRLLGRLLWRLHRRRDVAVRQRHAELRL